MMARSFSPRISFCIPLYNEEKIVEELLQRVDHTLGRLPQGSAHEIIVVDDGSKDQTVANIEKFSKSVKSASLKLVQLSRNFGHQAALSAGLDEATGDFVFVIDGDLQDPPESLSAFLALAKEGYDIVYGVREKRKEGFLLRILYFLFYRFLNFLSDRPLPLDSGDNALLSARAVRQLRALPERNQYLRGMRSFVGFKQVGLVVERDERLSGKSKYSLRKLVSLGLDGVFAFSIKPVRIVTFIGFSSIGLGFIFGIYSIGVWYFRPGVPQGFTALATLIIFFCGVQLLCLGILGEYLARVYNEVKQRPIYVVEAVRKLPLDT